MRDDNEGGLRRSDEPLEPLEPVEVEVVRRLVEQEDVVAREQDRGERVTALASPPDSDSTAASRVG